MREAGASGEVSYTEAAARVEALAKANRVRVVSGLALSAVGIAASVLLLAPGFTNVFLNGGGQPGIVIAVGDMVPVDPAVFIPDENVPLSPGPAVDTELTVGTGPDGGVYPVQDGEADCDIPVLEGFTWDDDYVYVRFSDSGSGVAWGSVHAVDPDGIRIEPVELRPEEGMVVLELPDSDLVLYIQDKAGNWAQSGIYRKPAQ